MYKNLWGHVSQTFIRSTSTSGNVISTGWRWKITQRSIFRHTVWPWRGLKVWLDAIKTRGSVSRTYMVQSSPNNTCKTRVPAWWPLHRNYDLKSQRPLVETGSDMFLYFDELLLAALQYTAQKSSVKSLDHGQNCDISSTRVNIEVWRRIIPRRRTRCCHYSSVQCPITAKHLSPDQRPSLNSSMCQYFLTVIAPPTDSPWNRKYFVNPLFIIQNAPNYRPMITILTWTPPYINISSGSERHLKASVKITLW